MAGIKNMDMAKVLVLKDEVVYQPGQVVSKTLAQNEHLSVTLFAFIMAQLSRQKFDVFIMN